MIKQFGLAAVLAVGGAQAGGACTPDYVVVEGDTLFSIAQSQLGDLTRWSEIFYTNSGLQGGSLLDVPVGTVLVLPCPEQTAGAAPSGANAVDALDPAIAAIPEATPVAAPVIEPPVARGSGVRLLTGSGFAPFTDLQWGGRGLVTELVRAAMDGAPDAIDYSISWEDDWSAHLVPLLDSTDFDMGFPWFKPDCDATPDDARCRGFHFSDPVVDLVTVLVTRNDNRFEFRRDADLSGKVLCRPAPPAGGWDRGFPRPLVRGDRQLGVTVQEQGTQAACFDLLMDGAVDAVVMNEFLAVQALYRLGLEELAGPLARPLSVEGMHLVVSKKHWRATTLLQRFNAGLASLRQSEAYQEITARHLAQYWALVRG